MTLKSDICADAGLYNFMASKIKYLLKQQYTRKSAQLFRGLTELSVNVLNRLSYWRIPYSAMHRRTNTSTSVRDCT